MNDLTKPDDLTQKQFNFALAYMALGDANAAYRQCYDASRMKPSSVSVAVNQLMRNDKVAYFIEDLRARKAAAVMDGVIVTEQMIVNLLWQIATADPNELIAHRLIACRYCHGDKHRYQWRDAEEYAEAIQDEVDRAAREKRHARDVPVGGGFGYNKTAAPHPSCPKCCGEGIGDVVIADTRNLTGNAKKLYAGVKVTRDGIEVKMRDQDKALDTLATYAGLRKGKGDEPPNINMFFQKVVREIIDTK